MSLTYRQQARQNSEIRRNNYNHSVTNDHNKMAVEAARVRELNEMRIKQLEEIEQQMVQDLQRTLQTKNQVMNNLASKSKGLKKVMQPRLAYKYAPRENSTTDLINMQAQSQYAFSGRKQSNPGQLGQQEAVNIYNRRAKSIAMSKEPNAGPQSGAGGFMFNDSSATKLP